MKKAKLTIVLKADNMVVAEVENPQLWQQVLAAIHSDDFTIDSKPLTGKLEDKEVTTAKHSSSLGSKSTIEQFAKSIGVKKEELEGALGPIKEEPYLQLNKHCWAAMKKSLPSRGSKAINPAALAGTLLALWLEEAKLNIQATQVQTLAILKAMGVDDGNASRGIKNTPWLSARAGGVIIINPAHIEEAQEIARKFCTKNWSDPS